MSHNMPLCGNLCNRPMPNQKIAASKIVGIYYLAFAIVLESGLGK
jgi:hypothetical protein